MTTHTSAGTKTVSPAFLSAYSLGIRSGNARWHNEHRYASSCSTLPQ